LIGPENEECLRQVKARENARKGLIRRREVDESGGKAGGERSGRALNKGSGKRRPYGPKLGQPTSCLLGQTNAALRKGENDLTHRAKGASVRIEL